MDPSAPGRALAQFLHPWETRLQGCRASQPLAKPLWLPAVCEGFSPLSWRRAVAPGKPFLRKLEQGWQLRSAVRESLCLPSWPPAQQRVVLSSHHSSLSPLDRPGEGDMLPAQNNTRFCWLQPQSLRGPPRAPQAAAAPLSGLCHAQGCRVCTQGCGRGSLGVRVSPRQSRAAPNPPVAAPSRHWGAALHSGTEWGSVLCPEDSEVGAVGSWKQHRQ